jgi:hypothetical protein
VPAEAQRFERRLGKRDVRFLAALGCAAVAAAIGGVLASAGGSHTATGPTCVTVPAAGVMGGGDWHYCGVDAAAYCRQHASESSSLAEQCDRLEQQ